MSPKLGGPDVTQGFLAEEGGPCTAGMELEELPDARPPWGGQNDNAACHERACSGRGAKGTRRIFWP